MSGPQATVWYSVNDSDDERHALRCDTRHTQQRINGTAMLAELCADDYHSNHDGWESRWPLTLSLFESEDGPELARFEIEREARPTFVAHRIK